ncbi:discoidin, CUB and LCCL domain-containing protein 2 isoform X2 [Lates calcarifer]|uniref:Discoidin, CUB and LCCL domain-containing protein 2 isoform X2 n=1 Tax=Lates calcarifer TaxID=8187 RepID=A0AAJ7VK92_LATCA|nr:discoidin, CUB and LCCL domain-containing protein 2 isoform X2 [Lates calcarifer]
MCERVYVWSSYLHGESVANHWTVKRGVKKKKTTKKIRVSSGGTRSREVELVDFFFVFVFFNFPRYRLKRCSRSRSEQYAFGLQAAMGRAVMVGRGPTGAGVLVLSILIILTTESCRAQKGDGCGPSVLGPSSGTLSSLGYPGTYPNNTVCEWEISVPRGNRVHFRFAELDIENSDCQVNYLRLYNGVGPTRSEIVKYCGLGLKVKELIESTGNQVTVQFMSGTHHTGRGFYLSYSTTEHADLITCLDKGTDFPEAEFSKYCPAGCLTSTEEISGTIPNGYRESSPLCVAAVHAGVVSNAVGGRISVVSSKGIPHYEGTLANNVTSTGGTLSNSLFTFKTNGCYGTLGLESGGVADTQLSASSVWEWNNVHGQHSEWVPSGARLKKAGLPWAPSQSDQHQWLQVDLKREKRITGITTTGSTLREYQYYVSAYRVQYSNDGEQWYIYREANSTQDKIFQGNINYLHEVRNNFIPPIEARFLRVNPTLWHQRIALKLELLGCQNPAARRRTVPGPRMTPPRHTPPPAGTKRPPHFGQTTHTPDIRNTTMPPHNSKGVALAAVLVPVLVMVLTALILTVVCALHWKNRKKSSEGTYDLPHWDRTEYAQPLVSGVTTLGARSTFKPDEGPDPGYSDPDLYDAPISPDVYHAYAEPLPASGSEYATPIVVDMGCHPSGGSSLSQPTAVCSFMGAGPTSLLTRTDSGQSGRSAYDTPKNATGQVTPSEDLTYQVPQSCTQKPPGQS